MIFATPDFGAGGCVLLVLAGVVLATLVLSLLAFFRGIDWCREKPPNRRWLGVLSISVGILLPICTCCGPSILFRLQHDTPPIADVPIGLIREGMSPGEVRAILGPPHLIETYHPPDVKWTYWRDAIRLGWYVVFFGEDGTVKAAHGD